MILLRRALIPIIMTLFLYIGSSEAEAEMKKAVFVPQWVPHAQFAGYYMAQEKGFYRDMGIDLTIIQGGPDNPSLDLLKDGRAHFATLWLTTGLEARDQGIPLVNISQISQKSALMLIAKKSSGIREPQDMEGRKAGLWGPVFQLQPRAFFKKYDVNVEIIRQSYSINLFLRDGVDVVSAMLYNEYHTILNSGLNPEELTTFVFHEHGLNFPEDGIYSLEGTCAKDPELCRAFVKASELGWEYAFENPEETIDVVMRNLEKARIPARRVHQRWMLDRMKDLVITEKSAPIGDLAEEDYYRVANALLDNGFIKTIPDMPDFFRRFGAEYEK